MAIFNSYVKLPEGKIIMTSRPGAMGMVLRKRGMESPLAAIAGFVSGNIFRFSALPSGND